MIGTSEICTQTIDDGVAVLKINSPPVNALGYAVRVAVYEGVTAAVANPAIDALVIICAGRTFFAGADIGEFGRPVLARSAQAQRERRRDRFGASTRSVGRQVDGNAIHALEARGKRYGLQAMCEGGGLANVTIVEAL